MRKIIMMTALPFVAAFSLTACGQASENTADFEMAESDAAESDAAAPSPTESAALKQGESETATSEIPVSKPQIAYSYDYGFRLPASEISEAQQAHISLCNNMPANGCRVLNMSNSGSEGDYASGRLHLEVAAPKARAFGKQLAKVIEDEGGSQIAASIAGEDLSKQIVDTEARLRSKILLSQRLTELLATRKGTVAELVEAERAVSQVNEEIDQARSWLKEMRGRVSYSKVMINYESGAPGSGGFTQPIREAFAGISSILGSSIGAAITLIALLLPWLLVIGLIVYVRRRFKASDRTFFGKKIDPEATPIED